MGKNKPECLKGPALIISVKVHLNEDVRSAYIKAMLFFFIKLMHFIALSRAENKLYLRSKLFTYTAKMFVINI